MNKEVKCNVRWNIFSVLFFFKTEHRFVSTMSHNFSFILHSFIQQQWAADMKPMCWDVLPFSFDNVVEERRRKSVSDDKWKAQRSEIISSSTFIFFSIHETCPATAREHVKYFCNDRSKRRSAILSQWHISPTGWRTRKDLILFQILTLTGALFRNHEMSSIDKRNSKFPEWNFGSRANFQSHQQFTISKWGPTQVCLTCIDPPVQLC